MSCYPSFNTVWPEGAVDITDPTDSDSNISKGSTEFESITYDKGRSVCQSGTPVIRVLQNQTNVKLILPLRDLNGFPVDITSITEEDTVYTGEDDSSSSTSTDLKFISGYNAGFIVRDTYMSNTAEFVKVCEVEQQNPGLVSCILPAGYLKDAGVYRSEVMITDTNGDKLYFAVPYWFCIEKSLFTDSNGALTIPEVRLNMRDVCITQNILINALEFSDEEIITAIKKPVDEFNALYQPKTSYTVSSFPGRWRFFWMNAVIGYLLRIAALSYSRNHLPYSTGGISVDDKNKANEYLTQSSMYLGEWRDFIKNTKLEINIGNGFGYIGSGYC
jgi:hypothetical protein